MTGAAPGRTLLVIAGEFPPVKTIGRIRTAKFVEHLESRGWHCVVVTVQPEPFWENYDPALEAEVPPGVEVLRAPVPDLTHATARVVKRLIGQSGPRRPAAAGGKAAASPGPATSGAPSPRYGDDSVVSVLARTYRSLLRRLLYIPDDYIGWALGAYRLGSAVCRERDVAAVVTSVPPFSACVAGYRLSREFGIPWVLDYRDLWTGDVLREWLGPVRRRLERGLERRLVRRADVVVAVSEQKTEFLRRLHPKAKARWVTLTNGYDTGDYAPLLAAPRAPHETVDFVFTGRLFKNRRGYAFAEALGRLAAESPALTARVRVHFYGGVSPEIRARYDEILGRYGISGQFVFHGDVTTEEARRAQVASDYLLLVVDTGATSDGVIPGKLFEYVAARRPIFALTDAGATKSIIERGRIGRVVPAESVEACRAALAEVLATPVPAALAADEAYLAQFDRRRVCERFAEILEEVAARPSGCAPEAAGTPSHGHAPP